jgi:hypothetical protein
VKRITGESFIPESLILPQGIPALCDDPELRTAILATLPTPCLEAPSMPAWFPVCRRGSQRPRQSFPCLCHGLPPLGQGQRGCKQLLRPSQRRGVGGREATPVAPRRWIVCLDPPIGAEKASSQKLQRTAGGAEETGSQAQGTQRRISPPPSGPPPPQPPPPSVPPPPTAPGDDLPQGHHHQQQQQQQQQQKQRSPNFQGR